MSRYEYKVIPAPSRGAKARGLKTPEARFAHRIETELNSIAGEGWEYLRADLLPSEERSGLTGTVTNWRTLLIFRRESGADSASAPPEAATIVQASSAISSAPPATRDSEEH